MSVDLTVWEKLNKDNLDWLIGDKEWGSLCFAAQVAKDMSSLSNCSRRQIGCVLLNDDLRVIAGGRNQSPWGYCRGGESKCPGADVPAGQGAYQKVDCRAVHAEVQAMLMARSVSNWRVCICTKAPCTICTGLLYKEGCQVILYETPSNETVNKELFPGLFLSMHELRDLKFHENKR